MITIERKVHFKRGQSRQMELREGATVPTTHVGRVPRVARLMALAIRLDRLIREGAVADQAELARLGHVTRARLTQIMNLLCLAPDLQEALLFLPDIKQGRDMVTEKSLRVLTKTMCWSKQRDAWKRMSCQD